MQTQIPISIDDILQSTAVGSIDKAITNNLYGINHEQLPSAVPSSKERQGYLFLVRPQLNLQLDNIRNSRKFMPLATDQSSVSDRDGNQLIRDGSTTIHRFVRTTLDPRLMAGYKIGQRTFNPLKCPLVNNEMAFIPILTNNVITSSGWPDLTIPLFTSKQGLFNESVSFADGLVEHYEQGTIDCTFRNTISDPILYMFYIWTLYMSYVFKGKFVPYLDFITNNRIDYNTRLFRIRMDRNRYKVTKIMSTGPALPMAASVGEFGDLNIDQIFSEANKDITIRFQYTGFEIFDDILILEFNKIVEMFKSDMKDGNRQNKMIIVPRSISYMFQHRAYPRINPENHVMEWWVDRSLFESRTLAFLKSLAYTDDIEAARIDLNEIETNEGRGP